MNIRLKMLIPMLSTVIVALVAVTVISVVSFKDILFDRAGANVESASKLARSLLDDDSRMSEQSAASIAANEALVSGLTSGDRDSVLTTAADLMKTSGAEFLTITDAEGNVIARAHDPDNFGDSVAGQNNVKSAMSGVQLTNIEKGSAVKLSVRSGAPVRNEAGDIVGVVSLGYRLDQDTFVDKVKSVTGLECTVFLGDERISTTVTQDGKRAIGTKANEKIAAQVLGGTPYSGAAQVLGNDAIVRYTPVNDANNSPVGMLFVGYYTAPESALMSNFVFTAVGSGAVVLIVAAIFSLFVSARIVKPIIAIVHVAERLAEGEVDLDLEVTTKDEVARLAEAFKRIIAANSAQAHTISGISDGDLTTAVSARSEKDVVGNALVHMLDMNNNAFEEINKSANRVANGARWISQSADTMEHGADESSRVVERLISAVKTIEENSAKNLELANNAADLSVKIRNAVDKGTRQMKEMSGAVYDINASGEEIRKVISVIDGIAFQTNILALNAAVEAARAGQHGKGFAVVAEEVRSLASKSAAAAKDTEALITNTLEKAEIGAAIAKDTELSLRNINDGITQNESLLKTIAAASTESGDSVTEISGGIARVAEVVRYNSDASKENSASSELLSGQADAMKECLQAFTLRPPKNPHDGEHPFDEAPAGYVRRPRNIDAAEVLRLRSRNRP